MYNAPWAFAVSGSTKRPDTSHLATKHPPDVVEELQLHASVASDWGLNWEMVRGAASAIDAKSSGALHPAAISVAPATCAPRPRATR